MNLGRDLLTALVLYLKFPDHVIIGGDKLYKGCSAPMAEVTDYDFKPLMVENIKPEESFINSYIKDYLS